MAKGNFKTTAAYLDREADNIRTEDEHELAAVDAIKAINQRGLFENSAEVEVSWKADEDGVEVSVSAS